MISPKPDIRTLEIDPEKDSWMILACDGIWNFMSSQEVVDYVNQRIGKTSEDKLSGICEEVWYFFNEFFLNNVLLLFYSYLSIVWLLTPWVMGLGAITWLLSSWSSNQDLNRFKIVYQTQTTLLLVVQGYLKTFPSTSKETQLSCFWVSDCLCLGRANQYKILWSIKQVMNDYWDYG